MRSWPVDAQQGGFPVIIQPINILPYSFFAWSQQTWFGHWIETQQWVFAITETIHILAFTILLGTTLCVDMRLLGFGMRRQPTARIAHDLNPWMWAALAVTVVTGILMYLSEAERLSISAPFFYKIIFFLCAIVLHFTIHRKATSPGGIDGAWFGKLAACLSLIFWLGVALAGRAIGFI